MQKLLKLLYSVLLGILVVIVTKLFLDSQEYGDLARHTDTLLNQSLLTGINNIRGDISIGESDINNIRGEVSIGESDAEARSAAHHVYTPPAGPDLEANDEHVKFVKYPVLFPSSDGVVSLETRSQFTDLMTSRSRRLREVCNLTIETKRKFNFRSF